jgi:hypothetical protein
MQGLFSKPKAPDTSKQDTLVAKQEQQIAQEEKTAEAARRQSAAATRTKRSGTAGLISGSELGVTPVGRTTIG